MRVGCVQAFLVERRVLWEHLPGARDAPQGGGAFFSHFVSRFAFLPSLSPLSRRRSFSTFGLARIESRFALGKGG